MEPDYDNELLNAPTIIPCPGFPAVLRSMRTQLIRQIAEEADFHVTRGEQRGAFDDGGLLALDTIAIQADAWLEGRHGDDEAGARAVCRAFDEAIAAAGRDTFYDPDLEAQECDVEEAPMRTLAGSAAELGRLADAVEADDMPADAAMQIGVDVFATALLRLARH